MLHFIKWILIMTGIFALLLIVALVFIYKSSTNKKSLFSSIIDCAINTQDSYQKTEEWTIETTDMPKIDVHNVTGSITIKGHNKDECIIKATKHGATKDTLNLN